MRPKAFRGEMKNELKYSEGKDFDIAQLMELYKYAWWTKERKAEDVKKMLENTGLILTVWDGKKLIGFTRVLTDFVYRATIWDVIIHPDYRGKGIGKKIMKRILAHKKLKSVENFWLYTKDKQEFYSYLGFKLNTDGSMALIRSGAVC